MKTNIIFLLFLSTILVSCASRKLPRSLAESGRDGLRFESLNRYNSDRLDTLKKQGQAIALCHKGEYNKAQDILRNQMDQNKDNPIYWNHLATCYLLENKLSRAKFYYDLALSVAKKKHKNSKAIIMNNIGLYYLKLNKPYLAKDAFDQSLKFNKELLTPQYNLAQIYLKFSQFKKASKILTTLFNKNNKDIDFIYSLGHFHLMQGQYTKANKYFQLIPSKYRTRDDIATNYALSLYFTGKKDMAYNIVKEADMENSHFLYAQTELIKKIERNKRNN